MKFDNEQLLKYIGACTSPYHTVDTSLQMLLDLGFTELSLEDEWQLDSGSYVVNVFGTTYRKETRTYITYCVGSYRFSCYSC